MREMSTTNRVVTLINVFTVDPTNQQRLVEGLTRATEVSSATRQALFRRVSIVASTRPRSDVCPVAHIEDYEAMRQDPAPLPFLQEAAAIATFEPGLYELAQTFEL